VSLRQRSCAKPRKELWQPLGLDFDLVVKARAAITQPKANLGRGKTRPEGGVDGNDVLGKGRTSARRGQQERDAESAA